MERICNDTLSRMEKLFGNTPLWAAFIAFVLAQAIKPFTGLLDGKGWNMRMLTTTGGMPSSHSATMAALTVSIAMVEGLGSHLFAISFVASLIIMNDFQGLLITTIYIIDDVEIFGHIKKIAGDECFELQFNHVQ